MNSQKSNNMKRKILEQELSKLYSTMSVKYLDIELEAMHYHGFNVYKTENCFMLYKSDVRLHCGCVVIVDTLISTKKGSVQHLDFLTNEEKEVYKTAVEIGQKWVIELAADRTPFICQAQSVNVFLAGDTDKTELHNIHYTAWKKGMKSLYYCRSTSIQRAEKVSHKVINQNKVEYDECLACQ